jgi:thiosulfate/3-mercaptopyruvate sulfurtransferase
MPLPGASIEPIGSQPEEPSGDTEAKLPARMVTCEWLTEHLGDDDLRVLDVRGDLGIYETGHIPGAAYFNTITARISRGGVPAMLQPPDALAIMLGELGITRETIVVVYGAQSDYNATYMIWALDCLGHPSAALLDGGYGAWVADGGETMQDHPDIETAVYALPQALPDDTQASSADVAMALFTRPDETMIIDVRPGEYYAGSEGYCPRKGHIKGAVNLEWRENLAPDGRFKPVDELRSMYETLGVADEMKLVTSCDRGLSATNTYFVLKHLLGYENVRSHDGSFIEWSNIEEYPVERSALP